MADEFIHRNYLIKQLYLETDISLTSPVMQTIETFPAADVQPVKRGEWVNGKCTICGKSLEDLFTGDFYYDDNEINFCPNCGSDMRGDEK